MKADSWYLEAESLLGAMRSAREARAPMPSIEGYEFIAEIARGGQGVVYLASQRAARKRFEREVEVVAGLDHVGIVRVFDGGVSDDGQPYLVMEHVDGVPLDRYLAGKNSDPKVTAEIVSVVCDALHAAHMKGVIHRDIKPSNVLIDAQGRPCIVDFGLARITLTGGRARTELSVRGQFLGSLSWASPEQAAGHPHLIDTRSDVYSTGVLLFQALTGAFPYPVDGTLSQALHAISTQESRRPSSIRREIPRDLDAIVLAALEKSPAARDQSAAEFARDLRAFIGGEPIQARREGAVATMTRTLVRYRRMTIVASLFSVALVAVTLFALSQTSAARVARERAERRLIQVRSIAGGFLFDLHEDLVKLEGSRPARERLVTNALAYLRDLQSDAGDDPAFLAELSEAWEKVGDIQGNPTLPNLGQHMDAMVSYREALALRERIVRLTPNDIKAEWQVGHVLNAIGFAQLHHGDNDAALSSLNDAGRRFEAAAVRAPNDMDLTSERMSNRDRRADVLTILRQYDEAIASLREAQQMWVKVMASGTDKARGASNGAILHGKIAFALLDRGQPKEALEDTNVGVRLTREATAASPGDTRYRRALNVDLNGLAAIHTALGNFEEAKSAIDESLAVIRSLSAADPTDPLLQSDLAYTINKLGELLVGHDDGVLVDEGIARMRDALALRRALREHEPANALARRSEFVALYLVADSEEKRAHMTGVAPELRRELLQSSRAGFLEAIERIESMRTDGVLYHGDEAVPDEFRARVAKLDAAIAVVSSRAVGAGN
ncbi:MAG: serine/threonine-protein kinase [Phycisphaerae bacterium]|nr:serine/threonine-protein kinase [Phycisphaerae bacterium]